MYLKLKAQKYQKLSVKICQIHVYIVVSGVSSTANTSILQIWMYLPFKSSKILFIDTNKYV